MSEVTVPQGPCPSPATPAGRGRDEDRAGRNRARSGRRLARRPIVAASAEDDDARYGFTAESPVSDWEGHVEEPLTLKDFEEIWAEARQHLTAPET